MKLECTEYSQNLASLESSSEYNITSNPDITNQMTDARRQLNVFKKTCSNHILTVEKALIKDDSRQKNQYLANQLASTNPQNQYLANQSASANAPNQYLTNQLANASPPNQYLANQSASANPPNQYLANRFTSASPPSQYLANQSASTNPPNQYLANRSASTNPSLTNYRERYYKSSNHI